MKYLLDTHVWLWYLLGSNRLSARHRKIIDDADSELWLSPISIWETALLMERGRVPVAEPAERWIAKAREQLPVREAPLTFDIAIGARRISLPYEDPADRFIAATAAVLDLTLLTSDKRLLRGSGYLTA